MSQTLATGIGNVRYLLNDRDPQNYAVSSPRLARVLVWKALELANKVGLGQTWTTTVVTLTSGSSADYSLTGSVAYSEVALMRINATGDTMTRVSLDEINSLREGIISTTAAQGDPSYFALWEDATQVVKMRIDTVPNAARTLDALTSVFPAVTYTDATTMPFSDLMLRAIEKSAALELSAGLIPQERERLGLNPDVFSLWAQAVKEGLYDERTRMARLKRGPYGVGAVVG